MRLSTRLLLLILACLVPIVGTQFYGQYGLHQQQRKELASLALRQAELANGDVASIASGLHQLAAAAAEEPQVRSAGPACNRQLAAMQSRTPAVLFFAALDRSGHALCTSLPNSVTSDGWAKGWVADLLAHPSETIGRYSTLPSGDAFVPFFVRSKEPDSPVAYLVAGLDLVWLAGHLRQVHLRRADASSGSALYITDRDGIVVGRSPESSNSIGRRLPADLLRVIDAHDPGTAEIRDSSGKRRLVASVPAALTPAGLAAIESLSLSDMVPDLLVATWRQTLPTLLASVLALVLAWFTGRHFISRPTQKLLSAAQRWRDGDLSARAELPRGNWEFTTLAHSFNAMASSLQARELERRLHSELLESQVAERTRALSDSNNRLQVEIAEREKTEAALHQAQKLQAVGQLAGGIAHDFNNMLATILGSLELMERRVAQSAERWSAADAERLARLIERATAAVLRGSQLTSRLLAFSRRQRLAARPTDLNQLVSDLVTLAVPTLGRRIQLKTALMEELWPALVDPSQMEAAILNCCLNARDAMPEGGQLTIRTANYVLPAGGSPNDPFPGDYVRVSISDTGRGMSPEVLRRAFDPFFTTKGPSGSGLGLSQVYGMVRQSGGTVRLFSTPGEGTEVVLLLPRAEASGQAPSAAAPAAPQRDVLHSLVLLVDDDHAVRQVATEMLKDLGCEVMQAATGPDALDVLETSEKVPDVILVDYAMPGMNGLELAQILRHRGVRAPIGMVTGYAELADGEAEGSPLDALLRKPFTIRELDELLMRLRRGRVIGQPIEGAI